MKKKMFYKQEPDGEWLPYTEEFASRPLEEIIEEYEIGEVVTFSYKIIEE